MTPVGRELDAAIAEKVMGLEWRPWKPYAAPQGWFPKDAPECNERTGDDLAIDADGYLPDLPMYSYDITEAWEVVEKARQLVSLEVEFALYANEDSTWDAAFGMEGGVKADTAPHAICLAALKAVGASE